MLPMRWSVGRHILRHAMLAATALILTACANAVSQTQQKFAQMWENRLVDYRAQAEQQADMIRRSAEELRSVLISTGAGEEANTRQRSLVGSIMELGKVDGRIATLTKFGDFRATKPTYGMTDAWFADQTDQMQRWDTESQARVAGWQRRAANTTASYSDWWTDLVNLARERGLILGAADELLRLNREMTGFVSDIASAERADEARQQRTLAALSALQQFNYQQQMLSAMNRPRTCTSYGSTVTCF